MIFLWVGEKALGEVIIKGFSSEYIYRIKRTCIRKTIERGETVFILRVGEGCYRKGSNNY